MIHDGKALDVDPLALGASGPIRRSVSGRSHRSACSERAGVLCVNRGGAGPRRFSLPIGVAGRLIGDGQVRVNLVTLAPPAQMP